MRFVRLAVLLAAVLSLVSPGSAQSLLLEDSLNSTALHRTTRHRIYRPADTTQTYPLLLLLHGFGGNFRDWSALTGLGREMAQLPLIVVMPDGDTSWYVNSPVTPEVRYEEYIVNELIPAAVDRYAADQAALGIAGLSMGGYGALVLALRHPVTFRFAGVLSGSLDIPFGIPSLEIHGRGGLRNALERSFGGDSTGWTAYDPFRLLSQQDPAQAPYLYLANGIQDEFDERMEYYRRFARELRLRRFPYEYHETPGRHDWAYWGREIGPVVRRFVELMGRK